MHSVIEYKDVVNQQLVSQCVVLYPDDDKCLKVPLEVGKHVLFSD